MAPTAASSAAAGLESAAVLWHDTSLFQARYDKAASALHAVRLALARNRPLGGGEQAFIDLYDTLDGLDEAAFEEVWRNPYAYFWLRIAFELLGSLLRKTPLPPLARAYCRDRGTTGTREALELHLADFKRIALACCVLSNRSCTFGAPLAVALPFAIPGTVYSLFGGGALSLAGYSEGSLDVVYNGVPLRLPLDGWAGSGEATVRVHRCPVITFKGCRIRLQPHAYNLPAIDYAGLVLQADLDYQRQNQSQVEEALAVMARHQPAVFGQFRELMRVIALKPAHPGSFRDNVSHSDLPGAFVANPVRQPYYLAHTLIHEFHHNRLFFIEDIEPIVENPGLMPGDDARYCSPLRVDPRPLHGIVHGLYVLIPVVRYWLSVYDSGEVSDDVQAMVVDDIVRSLLQIRIAVFQLDRYARFTPFGERLYTQMKDDVSTLEAAVRAAGLPQDAPMMDCREDGTIVVKRNAQSGAPLTSREAITERIRSCGLEDQVREILDNVSLGI
jgi:HEXXH motif-containing protein